VVHILFRQTCAELWGWIWRCGGKGFGDTNVD